MFVVRRRQRGPHSQEMVKLTSTVESLLSRVGLVRRRNSSSSSSAAAATTSNSRIGVLSFEIAGLMSKVVRLWQSLSDAQLTHLQSDVLSQEGIRKLVSSSDSFLLNLALAEFVDSFAFLARSTARLGRRCSDPVLRRVDHALAGFVATGDDPDGLGYGKMEKKVRKMERLVSATVNLYHEMAVLAEVELGFKRTPDWEDALLGHGQKLVWQRQHVRYLRDSSLWSKTYDHAVRLLAGSLFAVAARLNEVFEFESINSAVHHSGSCSGSLPSKNRRTRSKGGKPDPQFAGGKADPQIAGGKADPQFAGGKADPQFAGGKADKADPQIAGGFRKEFYGSLVDPQHKLNPPDSTITLGVAALALHYANVIVVIEKLAAHPPHLIGEDARDDLYGMLPAVIRSGLRTKLRAYAKDLSAPVYDPALASEWSDALGRIFEWLAPLARDMIRWQSERSYEQHQRFFSGTDVLLVQTLYHADQAKTEAAIIELLVGLNYLWRFGRELHAKAMREIEMDGAAGGCFDDPNLHPHS